MAFLKHALALSWALVLAAVSGLAGQGSQPSEYQLKAVFLFKLAQFVDWPDTAFTDPAAPLVICVLGTDRFGGFLDETVRGETIGGHPLAIRRLQSSAEMGPCHILFIGESVEPRVEAVLDSAKEHATLTVGEGVGFARRGGMVRFVSDRSRIRIRINLEATEAAQLRVSSKLLRAAEIVPTDRR